jgi:hypothetical protein
MCGVGFWERLSQGEKGRGFRSSSRDDETPFVELAVVLFFLVDILGFY